MTDRTGSQEWPAQNTSRRQMDWNTLPSGLPAGLSPSALTKATGRVRKVSPSTVRQAGSEHSQPSFWMDFPVSWI